MARDLTDHRPEVARALGDKGAAALCTELGIDRSKTERGKYVCPRHGGGSLSVRVNRADGLVQVRCFGCDFAGDVFVLVAEARGLSVRADFRRVLVEAATLAGLWGVVDELAGDRPAGPVAPRRSAPPPRPERAEPTYPDASELVAVWSMAGPVLEDDAARALLDARGLDAAAVDDFALARVLAPSATLPTWAGYKGDAPQRRSWTTTGHRLLLPTYDASGVMRSVRAWRVEGAEDTPKRLPPSGHRAAGLVLADGFAVSMLETGKGARRVLIVEGEPDFLTWATRFSDADLDAPVVLGVLSGAWTPELAARVPSGARVIVRTHHDASGDKYAEQINATLRERCTVLRPRVGT